MTKPKPEQTYSHGLGGKNQPRLNTLAGILKEQARIYRRALQGKMATEEATRFTYMLTQVRVTIESISIIEVQERMAALEALYASRMLTNQRNEGGYAKVIEHRPAA